MNKQIVSQWHKYLKDFLSNANITKFTNLILMSLILFSFIEAVMWYQIVVGEAYIVMSLIGCYNNLGSSPSYFILIGKKSTALIGKASCFRKLPHVWTRVHKCIVAKFNTRWKKIEDIEIENVPYFTVLDTYFLAKNFCKNRTVLEKCK